MAVCEQSGELRLFAELDEFGLSFGEPPEGLYSGAFFEEKKYRLPLADDHVGILCKSQPPSIVLQYATLDINEAASKPSLPATMDFIQGQEGWEAQTIESFYKRGYDVSSRHCLKETPYSRVLHGLETLTLMYNRENLDSSRDAFYVREELVRMGLTPDLCSRQITFKPKALKETASVCRKRQLSDAFPTSGSDGKGKRIRSDAQRARVQPCRAKTTGDATRSLTCVRPVT